MKKGWQTKTLGEVATVGAGNSAPQDEALFKDGTIPFFRTADAGRVRFGDILESEDYLNDKGVAGLRRFRKGTILFPKSGASTFLNHRVMLGVDGCVSSHLATIVADEKQAHPRFLLYFLSTVQSQDLVQDHAYPSLNLPTIAGIQIHLPSLAEQQRIVGVLDEAFVGLATAQANAAQNLQNARALFESHLQSVFSHRGKGWMETTLGEVAEFKNGLNYTRESKGQTLPVVGVGDFQSNDVVPLDQIQTATIDNELSHEYALQRGDILTVRSNGSKDLVGRCMLVPELSRTTSYSGFIIRIRVNQTKVLPAFLLHFMKSSDTRGRLTRDGGGANISNINQTKLSALPVSVPPVPEQSKVVARLDALAAETQRLSGLYEQKQAALAQFKKSLLHQAFTGQL